MQPIRFGDEGQAATRELVARFEKAGPMWERQVGISRFQALRADLATLERIDRQYGGESPVPLEGVDDVVGALLTELAHFQADVGDEGQDEVATLVLGVALWAIRHDVAIRVVEPVVNALAYQSNSARSRPQLAAAFGVMQGVIAHVADALSADLERSNPERPWRLLHLNMAITAIRTADPDMIEFAFDSLESALPDERTGFFAEALARALGPKFDPDVRNRIEKRHLKWTPETGIS
jgi:hypothetical protein